MAILERVSDQYGCAVFGWVGPGVFYARFERDISADVGVRFARRFESLIGDTTLVRYFGDSSHVSSYDLMALKVLMDALMGKQRQFSAIVVRPWMGVLSAKYLALPNTLGCLEYADSADFESRLRSAAPSAGLLELTTLVDAGPGARASAESAPPQPPPSGEGIAYSYAFDLGDFEKGRFAARRFALLSNRPRDAWVCVARNDDQALALARQAALDEWAKPETRKPQEFTVQFVDTLAGAALAALAAERR